MERTALLGMSSVPTARGSMTNKIIVTPLPDKKGPPTTKPSTKQPSKKLRKQVKAAFDANALIDICERDALDFDNYAERVDLAEDFDGRPRFYYYRDNGSDILAIAHLDSVQRDRLCQVTDTAAGLLATCGALDDRLGAYVILELLPKLGINCDILLTTDEEICDTTAADFDCDKAYHWMFSFDRGGTDVVMYDYDTPELGALITDAGGRVGKGSYSDICALEHLGCAGMNWGVGYEDYHSARAHAWLEDTFRQVARFVKFYEANKATWLEHEQSWVDAKWSGRRGGGWRYEDDYSWSVAADCGHVVDMADDTTFAEYGREFVCIECSVKWYDNWNAKELEKGA